MPFDDLLSEINSSCVAEFGSEYAFSRVTTLQDAPSDDPATITGIVNPGAELEENAPGDDSAYVRFSMQASEVSVPLQRGDEITVEGTVYKIVDIGIDAGGMVEFLLRKDREAD